MCTMPLNDNGNESFLLYAAQDKHRVQNLFWLPEILMQCMGQLPLRLHLWLPARLIPLGKFLAHCYSALTIFSTLHLGVLFMKTTFDTLADGDLQDITDALTMTVIYFFAAYATCYWLYRSPQLMAFLASINRQYRHHSLPGNTFVSAYEGYRRARNFVAIWECACFSGVFFWGITPLIMGWRTLPLKCWYPFDQLQDGVYPFIYVSQVFSQVTMGLIFGNGSSLFVVLSIIMLAQFDVLYCSLKNLDSNARIMAGEPLSILRTRVTLPIHDSDELNQYIFLKEHKTDLRVFAQLQRQPKNSSSPNESVSNALHIALIDCVQHHRFILESCDTLEALFNPYCLIKSLQITIQLCLLVFVGVQGERTTIRIVNQLQYLSLTAFELLMFTYCGELLRNHSVRAGDAFWRSNWWQYGHSIRQDVLIFLTNSRRVVKLTAGKFYVMDVERLRSVVTQAFSFLTLLQKLAAKKDDG